MVVEKVYNCEHALQVVEVAIEDYKEDYGSSAINDI
jgi:hypothetical protein